MSVPISFLLIELLVVADGPVDGHERRFGEEFEEARRVPPVELGRVDGADGGHVQVHQRRVRTVAPHQPLRFQHDADPLRRFQPKTKKKKRTKNQKNAQFSKKGHPTRKSMVLRKLDGNLNEIVFHFNAIDCRCWILEVTE